ncbi:MAG: hypothetical protein HC913_23660 [Microscillaceae bacterium]|nr:hypothetical protein [Microscillaceae bacterium]
MLAFAAPYRHIPDEAFKEKIPEIIEKLPGRIKYDLRKPLVIERRVEEATQIIVKYTQWDISKAQLLIKGGLQQKMDENFRAGKH